MSQLSAWLRRLLSGAMVASVLACAGRKPATPSSSNSTISPALELLKSPPPGPDPPETYTIRAALPPTFPSILIPAGGLVERVGTSDAHTVVVSSVLSTVQFDRIHFEWMLEDGGWVNRQAAGGGFNSTGAWPTSSLCRGTDFVTLRYRRLPGGVQLVRAAVGKEPTRSCAPSSRPMGDVPVPPIDLPGSIKSSFSGSVVSADDTMTRARLESSLSLDELNGIVVPQLTAVGWTVDGRTMTSRDASITRLNGRSKAGDPVTAVLLFVSVDGPGSSVGAMLRVVRPKSASPITFRPAQAEPRPASLADEVRSLLAFALPPTTVSSLSTTQQLPENFPKALLFPQSEIVTIAASPTTTAVISTVPSAAPFDPTHFEWGLEAAGWIIPAGPTRSGFGGQTNQPAACRGSEVVTLSYRTLAGGDHLVRALLGPVPQNRPCVPRQKPPMGDIPMPGLELPPEVARRGGGGGTGGVNDTDSHSRLETSVGLETLSDLCARQMVAAGWIAAAPIPAPRALSFRRYTITTPTGQRATGVVMFTGLDGETSVDALEWVFRAPVPPAGETSDFSLHINQEVGYAPVTILSQLYGPSIQSRASEAATRIAPLDFRLKTSASGRPASGLKAVVYCPGYRFAFLDVPAFDAGPRHAAIDLVRLRTIPLKGRVALPSDFDVRGLKLEIVIDAAPLAAGFFGTQADDGPVLYPRTVTVATASLNRDGTFEAAVPDLANDPAFGRTPAGGRELRFHLSDGTSPGPIVLTAAGAPSKPGSGLPVAGSYPRAIRLQFDRR